MGSVMNGDNRASSGCILRPLYLLILVGIIYGLYASCGFVVCLFADPEPKVVDTRTELCPSTYTITFDIDCEFGDSILVETLKNPWFRKFCPAWRLGPNKDVVLNKIKDVLKYSALCLVSFVVLILCLGIISGRGGDPID
jgi:hypothetical protein